MTTTLATEPSTSAGSHFYIGTTAAVPSTDVYTEVGVVNNIPEFGRSYSEIKFDALNNRDTLKYKGQRDDGSITIELGRNLSDSGQAAMIAALDMDFDYNFRITLNDASTATGATPTTFEFKAKVMSFTTNIGTANQVVGAKAMISIKTSSIVETPAT